ncbi:MAG: hypothetical protein RLZZ505_2237, partial [Verrucomicrobiota bacterium]
DSENRLLSVTPNTPAIGEKSLAYIYDAHHRRTIRNIQEWNGNSWGLIESTRFLYDGWNVIAEYALTSTTETLIRERTWGTDLSGSLQGAGGVGGLLMVEEIGTTTSAYHYQYDGNGNVTEITDHTGAKVATYRYDAFGNTLVATGSYAATNRYRFSTKPLDNEIANAPLYYYAYRYYDPMTGRWPSRDPIGERGGLNLYGFVGNDGVNWLDFLGFFKAGGNPYKQGGLDGGGGAGWAFRIQSPNLPRPAVWPPPAPVRPSLSPSPPPAPVRPPVSPNPIPVPYPSLQKGTDTDAQPSPSPSSSPETEITPSPAPSSRPRPPIVPICVFSRFGNPFMGFNGTPLEHGGTDSCNCVYECSDGDNVFIPASKRTECPHSLPPYKIGKHLLLGIEGSWSPGSPRVY